MDSQIFLILVQDGAVTGAIYALMALALVLVFSVTRVIFIAQGEFVSYAALSMAALQAGKLPLVLLLLPALALLTLISEFVRQARGAEVNWRGTLLWTLALPLAAALLMWLRPQSVWLQCLAVMLLIIPMGPMLYRLTFRPIARASVLMLLIVSIALHEAMVGLGLYFFGAEGARSHTLLDLHLDWGGIPVTGQSLVVIAVTLILLWAMYLFFGRSIMGKALRATAMNQTGARLMGIPTDLAGDLSFALAAFIGAISGILIGPMTTLYYDTGFIIGLKGFVAGIVGGLVSYPLAVLGALLVGQLEAFASFWASPFKEAIVFTLIIPVLWWRSMQTRQLEDEA